MLICNCNPFSDRDVKAALDGAGKASVARTYLCCSGGASPECCRCLPALKDMVQAHNAAVTVERIKHDLEQHESVEVA